MRLSPCRSEGHLWPLVQSFNAVADASYSTSKQVIIYLLLKVLPVVSRRLAG
jgi:hypothetical protein